MTRRKNFKVIMGGNLKHPYEKEKIFVSAYVTDTRLMGVLVIFMHWEVWDEDPATSHNFYQFFYLDAEEGGIERYVSITDPEPEMLISTEQTLVSGLGGTQISLVEDEVKYILRKFSRLNKEAGVYPDLYQEFAFLLSEPIKLSKAEEHRVVSKMCAEIQSDEELIHYFLMRAFEKDLEGILYLAAPKYFGKDENFDELLFYKGEHTGTLCKNTVEKYKDKKEDCYMCEALVEIDDKHEILVIEVFVEDRKIASASLKSSLPISPQEASILMNRSEFTTVFEIITDQEDFFEIFTPFSNWSIMSECDNGQLCMQFNDNNDHVKQSVFQLNEDIYGLYFISDYGQFIVSAYSLKRIREIEKDLKNCLLGAMLVPIAKYEFKEPVLYEFVQSDFEDFMEFVDILQ